MSNIVDDTMEPEFASVRGYWEFQRHVRQRRRYVWDGDVRAFLDAVLRTKDGRDLTIPIDSIWWRAQDEIKHRVVYDRDGKELYEEPHGSAPERMKPLPHSANEGRTNSAGIPVLYLASTEETAISEVRPWVGSQISVAQVKIIRGLKAIDLSLGLSKPSSRILNLRQQIFGEEPDAETKKQAVWTDIENAFSRPVTLPEKTADYVPTQILTELFLDAGYDAIIYRSQFGENGFNMAVFDIDNAKVINGAPYEVSSIEVKYKQIGNAWFTHEDAVIVG